MSKPPPNPLYPKRYDSDETLFLVYNTSESILSKDNPAWSEEIDLEPIFPFEVWADSGFANLDGELFYYNSVERADFNGVSLVVRFKGCIRNLGGSTTKINKRGTKVRGYVVAEHHNQIVDAIINIEKFVGSNFTDDQDTLDWRIRNLAAIPVFFDDHSCPDVNFTFNIIESNNITGIVARYLIQINNASLDTTFILDFGDGTTNNTFLEGTHTYAVNSNIDPVLTVANSLCSITVTPTERENNIQPKTNEITTLDIPVPPPPEIPTISITPIVILPNKYNIPPIVFPCLDISPIGGPNIPSIIEIVPPPNIPPLITITPINIPTKITITPINIPTNISITPINIPTLINITPINIPTNITITPPNIPTIITITPINIPSVITVTPPNIPTIITITPINIPTTITITPPNIPTIITITPPNIPTLILFGSINIPTFINIAAPTINIPTFVKISPVEIPTYIDIPTTIKLDKGDIPTTISIEKGDIPTTITIDKGDLPTYIEFAPLNIPTVISIIQPSNLNIPSVISFQPLENFPTRIYFDENVPSVIVDWNSANVPTVTCIVTVECGSSSGRMSSQSNDYMELEVSDLGIPSVISIAPPVFPKIKIDTDEIPSFIQLGKIEGISEIKILPPSVDIPSEIKIINQSFIPSVISLESKVPESIVLKSDLPEFLSLKVPEDFPKEIKLNASDLPREIQVVGVPSVIQLQGYIPSIIQLVMPEKPEIEMVYRGAPIDVKVQLDLTKLNGDGDGTNCVSIVPCK